ncbi:MAG: hypothetical protein JJ863_23310 [Deltaproteobacteria bacterium]|nr:hypothetical protein [Deltaproteobacteria bacterium]
MRRANGQTHRRGRASALLEAGCALLEGDVEAARRLNARRDERERLLWFAEASERGWRAWRTLAEEWAGPLLGGHASLRLLDAANRFDDLDWAWKRVLDQGFDDARRETKRSPSAEIDLLRHGALRVCRLDLAAELPAMSDPDPWNAMSAAYVALACGDRSPALRVLSVLRAGLPIELDPGEFAGRAAMQLEAVLDGHPSLATAIDCALEGLGGVFLWAQLHGLSQAPAEPLERWFVEARIDGIDAAPWRRITRLPVGLEHTVFRGHIEAASAEPVRTHFRERFGERLVSLSIEPRAVAAGVGQPRLISRSSGGATLQVESHGGQHARQQLSVDLTLQSHLHMSLGTTSRELRTTLEGFQPGRPSPSVI